MTTGVVQEHNMEKQMGGCMAGFFNIFDRHQNFTGKRHFATRRLPPSAVESEPGTEKSSPAGSTELSEPQHSRSLPSPDRRNQCQSPDIRSPSPDYRTPAVENPARAPLPLPVFELNEGTPRSPWRFSKEAPRLSLDSRAVVDAKGTLKPREIQTNAATLSGGRSEINDEATDERQRRRSPSVIARLMGLEQLTSSDPEPTQRAELRRSASESRLNRGRYGFIDGVSIQSQDQSAERNQQRYNQKIDNVTKQDNGRGVVRAAIDRREVSVRRAGMREPSRRAAAQRGIVLQRRNFFDSADFFPELPPKQSLSVYGEMEKRLKVRGIDEPCKDLDTLKQVLEALQLKGLLHPSKPHSQTGNRNLVFDRSCFLSPDESQSQIFVLRPVGSPQFQPNREARQSAKESAPSRPRSRIGARLPAGEVSPAGSPRRERPVVERRTQGQRRNLNSPARSECGLKSPSQRKTSTVEMNRRLNEPPLEQRRVRPVQSPKIACKRTGPVQTGVNPSPRNRKPAVKVRRKHEEEDKQLLVPEDELSTVSGSSLSTCSPTDTEQRDYKERNLLERCGKLLDSIAEMTVTARATASDLQPSPVSVLDSSFYKETSPSPILKRSIDFNEQLMESEDEMCSSAMSSNESKSSDGYDFAYVSDIIRASNYLADDPDVFSFLEKEQYLKGKDTSKVSRLERRLIFDTINEILDRKRKLPPWKAAAGWCRGVSLQVIWSEFRKIKERDESEDLFEAICGVLRKDLAGDEITGWGGCHVEVSETVLDIERLIFKDLISETIRHLAAVAGSSCNTSTSALSRRKLVF